MKLLQQVIDETDHSHAHSIGKHVHKVMYSFESTKMIKRHLNLIKPSMLVVLLNKIPNTQDDVFNYKATYYHVIERCYSYMFINKQNNNVIQIFFPEEWAANVELQNQLGLTPLQKLYYHAKEESLS